MFHQHELFLKQSTDLTSTFFDMKETIAFLDDPFGSSNMIISYRNKKTFVEIIQNVEPLLKDKVNYEANDTRLSIKYSMFMSQLNKLFLFELFRVYSVPSLSSLLTKEDKRKQNQKCPVKTLYSLHVHIKLLVKQTLKYIEFKVKESNEMHSFYSFLLCSNMNG